MSNYIRAINEDFGEDTESVGDTMKKSWKIEITLCRTFDGTEEEAEEVACEEVEYHEAKIDGDQFVSYPCAWLIKEIKHKEDV